MRELPVSAAAARRRLSEILRKLRPGLAGGSSGRNALFAVIGSLLLSLAPSGWAQKASNWRVYKAVDGMPEAACVAVYLSPQGKVLARHLNLPYLSELDGYRVRALAASPNSKAKVYISPGGQIWTVVQNGLEEFKGGTWLPRPIPEIARFNPTSMLDPVPLYPIRQDLVLMLFPDRLVELNTENADLPQTRVLRLASETALGNFLAMTPARNGGLWISGTRGLARIPGPLRNLKPDTAWAQFPLPASLGVENLQQLVQDGPAEREALSDPAGFGRVTMLGESRINHNKVVVSFDGQDWQATKPLPQKLRHAWRGPDGTGWAMTIDSLWQWQLDSPEMTEIDEVSARQYFDVAVEPSGAFWLATSDGLFRYAPLLWCAPAAVRNVTAPLRCLAGDQERRLWFVAGNRLYALTDDGSHDYPLPQVNGRSPLPRALYFLKSGTLVLAMEDPAGDPAAAEQDLLFTFSFTRGVFEPVARQTELRKTRALGMLKAGTLCVRSTSGGDAGQDTKSETRTRGGQADREKNREAGGKGYSLLGFDGRDFEVLGDAAPTNLGAPQCLFCTQGGDVWISGEAGTACLRERRWSEYVATDQSMPQNASCFVDLPNGKIWCAVQEQIWEFDGHAWSLVRRMAEPINQLQRGKDGSIWVASNNGLYRFFREAWVENGLEDGLPSTTVRDLFLNERGLWAATSRGLSLFHPEADPESEPPHTFVQKLSETGNTAPEGSTVFISFFGRDMWKYTARERLLYSYRRDDLDWSIYQDLNQVAFTDLSPGKHYFQVRAMDRNCNVDSPAQLEFVITLPWYKEMRLLAIACAGAAAALFFGGLAVNRHVHLKRSYAEIEKKVAERTRQLELASEELHHSQKMTALGTLAAGVAHDFNNILSIIKGSAQIIEDNLDNPGKIKIRTDRIRTVVEQGAGIVKAMLGFSGESGATESNCDINSTVAETLKLLGDRFLREVKVEFKPGADLPEVPAVKEFVQQILLNFIFNAAESMNDHKRIRVVTAVTDRLPGLPALKPAAGDQFVAVSVQDSGCGIPPENLQRIFEPFFTTKALSTRRGTGLGLSMVYELARKLGAGLGVESVVGHGSTFTLLLPLRELQSPVSAERGRAQPETSTP